MSRKTPHSITVLASVILAGSTFLSTSSALAACSGVGTNTINCDATSPNPHTVIIGAGKEDDGTTVTVNGGSTISTDGTSAISLGNDANITLKDGSLVTNIANKTGGNYGTGLNTIEFRSNGTLVVQKGASVIKTGTNTSSEAVNVHGFGNVITNHGLIQAENSAAIWFQDQVISKTEKNTVDNYGIIERVGGGDVLGTTKGAGIIFKNQTGAQVLGNIKFAKGDDDLYFYAGSVVTGNIDGGDGDDSLTLEGATGSEDILRGDITNFETLTKDGEGKWTVAGTLSGFVSTTVKNGTLALTGDNANYTGRAVVEAPGILEASAQSLPTKYAAEANIGNIENDGLVRFTQDNDGTYIGQIIGSGAVEKVGEGVLTLAPVADGGNSYSGGTTIKQGTLATSADNQLGAASGGITFDGGTLRFDSAFDLAASRALTVANGGGTIDTQGFTTTISQGTTGTGNLSKAGGGTLILAGDNAHSGGTNVKAGVVALDKGSALSGGGIVAVAAGATLGGYGTVTGPVNNAGTLAVADALDVLGSKGSGDLTIHGDLANTGMIKLAGAGVGNNLQVNGNYSGANGQLEFNTVLGDDRSKTDQMRISGSTAGNATVKVNNIGGTGAPTNDGIKIIDVGGASNGNFVLQGDYVIHGQQAVVGGAYSYTLNKNGKTNPKDGDWYLRSELSNPPIDPQPPVEPGKPQPPVPPLIPLPIGPIYQPGIPVYEAYAQTLQSLNGLPTLQQRVGNRYWSVAGNMMIEQGDGPGIVPAAPAPDGSVFIEGRGIWARIEGAHHKFEPRFSTAKSDYDINTVKFQVGLDGMLHEAEQGSLIGGITVHYGHAKTKTYSVYGDGDISTNGYGFGGTLTWYGNNGFYLDGQAQVSWYDSDLNSKLAQTSLLNGNHGFGYALSLEAGQRIELNDGWSMTPQAQLVYSRVKFDGFDDVFDAHVSLDKGSSLNGRLGLTVDRESSWMGDDGKLQRLHGYGIANLYYEFLDGSRIDVAGTKFTSQNQRVWGGLGLGGSYNWSGDAYSLYGEGSVNTSLNDFGNSYNVKGNIGLRIKW